MSDESAQNPPPVPVESNPPAPRIVAVVGELPFVGALLANTLADKGLIPRVLCPDAAAEAALRKMSHFERFEIVEGDLGSEDAVSSALKDTHGACLVSPISMSGRMYRPNTHLEDVSNLAKAAKQHALRRVVYHSAVGAGAGAHARALREAASAEELISTIGCEGFRIRTGPLMGRGDGFLTEIVRAALRAAPFMTIDGYGGTLVQPLAVNDFANGLARVFTVAGDSVAPGLYALVGPKTFSLLELTDSVLELGRKFKIKLHLPLFLLKLAAAVPGNAVFRERVELLFDAFAVEHNDAEKLMGAGVALRAPLDVEKEILKAS
jgi:nucleoside-diphosphate-sugar epimerase